MAQHAAAVSHLFNALAQSQDKLSQFTWVPQQGWAYWGGEIALIVKDNRGIFARAAEADFNQIFDVLAEPRYRAESRYRVVA